MFLEEIDGSIPKVIFDKAEKCKELYDDMATKYDAYLKAEEAYKNFAYREFPNELLNQGLREVTTADGVHIKVVTKTSTSVKKDYKDDVCTWLQQRGGEYLVKESLTIPTNYREILDAAAIPYDTIKDVNTTSLKSWLLDNLGQKNSPATLSLSDIPEGISFFQWNEVEIKK